MRASRPAASTSETISSLLIALASTGPSALTSVFRRILNAARTRAKNSFSSRVSTAGFASGVSLSTAAPGGTAGKATTGIGVQNAALSIWTGAAGTGIGIQGTTLDVNTLPLHLHQVVEYAGVNGTIVNNHIKASTNGDTGNLSGYAGASWAHAHGVSDPGHAHAVGSDTHGHGLIDNGHTHAVTTAAHGHTVTDGGHTHTLTAQALSTLPPYYALCFIMKL